MKSRPAFVLFVSFAMLGGCRSQTARLATPQEVIESKTDLWGEAALRQPDGPSYEFFEKLLPTLRYVDADFKHYPINLSAPAATVKGRLVSNGSAINALARQPNWNNERGTPVHILVGDQRVDFGSDLKRLDGPHYLDGYLPIAHLRYDHDGEIYREEVFASVDPDLAAKGAILVKFDLPDVDRGRIELRFEDGYELFKMDARHVVYDSAGSPLAQLDDNWDFGPARSSFMNKVQHSKAMIGMIFTVAPPATTRPATVAMAPEFEATGGPRKPTTMPPSPITSEFYGRQRALCIARWNEILAAGTQVQVPEPLVNNAWRTLLVAQYGILSGDHMNYSASNQYARKYANESGDSLRSLMLWGHGATARKCFKPLFEYRRPGIELHDGAFKLEDLADYYFVTRDADLIRELRPLWQREIDLILSSRQPDGLQPKEAYCSDIRTPVRSLNNNANCWRGLRDMSIILDEIGEKDQAAKLATICADYKTIILAAMDKAIVRDVDPPFVRIALDGEEPVSNPITSTRYGSYWNLVIPCVLWSGIFPIDSEPANFIMQYIQRNGGLCMGLTRVQSVRGVWMNVQNIDDLYVIRYSNALLKRDEPDRALVTFYGKLAQGFTRETFMDGESTSIIPLDKFGRQVALPPNSTANASFLIQLRNLLVQDWDMDDDGRGETLRLLFATPRRWLEDGKEIKIQEAPTVFGEVSIIAKSKLSNGQVTAEIDLPKFAPVKTLLRFRLPRGWKINSASAADQSLNVDGDTIDLTPLRGHVTVTAKVAH